MATSSPHLPSLNQRPFLPALGHSKLPCGSLECADPNYLSPCWEAPRGCRSPHMVTYRPLSHPPLSPTGAQSSGLAPLIHRHPWGSGFLPNNAVYSTTPTQLCPPSPERQHRPKNPQSFLSPSFVQTSSLFFTSPFFLATKLNHICGWKFGKCTRLQRRKFVIPR